MYLQGKEQNRTEGSFSLLIALIKETSFEKSEATKITMDTGEPLRILLASALET